SEKRRSKGNGGEIALLQAAGRCDRISVEWGRRCAHEVSSPSDTAWPDARFAAARRHGDIVGARGRRWKPRFAVLLGPGAAGPLACRAREPDEPRASVRPARAAAAGYLRRPHGRHRRVRARRPHRFAPVRRHGPGLRRGRRSPRDPAHRRRHLPPTARLPPAPHRARAGVRGRQTNRVEQIQFKRADVTEAWQESGQDWATVYVAASLVDYTLDDTTRNLVDGSRTPQDVEEYWTFTRPVGPTPWRLSAIQTS